MLISFISNTEFAYINLHAEQAFRDNEFLNLSETYYPQDQSSNTEMGIYCKDLKLVVIRELIKSIDYIKEKRNINKFYCIVIDFEKIKKIQPNMKENFNKFFKFLLELEIDILMINIDKQLINDIQTYAEDFNLDEEHRINKAEYIYILRFQSRSNNYNQFKSKEKIIEFTEQLFKNAFNEALNKSCDNNSNALFSSPVYTSKYINIKRCIEEMEFFPYALYKLATKLINENIIKTNLEENKKMCLVCHTLNGAYIASMLSTLLCLNLVFFDHIGPNNRLFKTFLDKQIDTKKSYIIVTDVICLGSELRAVKTLLDYTGAQCTGAISIVNCKTVNKNNCEIDRYSLLELTKDYNPIEYYISTDLEKK